MNGLTVLIVDDELHNRVVLQTMLQQNLPFITQIYQAATIAEALHNINVYHPQIVFLDVQMNNETGFDLLQQIPYFNSCATNGFSK